MEVIYEVAEGVLKFSDDAGKHWYNMPCPFFQHDEYTCGVQCPHFQLESSVVTLSCGRGRTIPLAGPFGEGKTLPKELTG